MPKFVLVDNSLAPAGGHHFEFADAILSAAERAGYSPHIGANLELPPDAELARRWPTFRVFPSSIYHDFNLFYLSQWEAREASKKARSWPGPLRRVANFYNGIRDSFRRNRWQKKRQIRREGFVSGCSELFKEVALEKGDIVILPTVSDVELEGLGTFLRENPATAVAQWHLYFHNNFLIGRPHEYDAQRFRIGLMTKSLQACLEGGKHHDLRFYTTTEQLADQFDRLKLPVSFQQLTFPVRETLRGVARPTGKLPKRLVCAGGFRDERGQFTLPQIVSAIWNDVLKPGHAQIQVQRSDPSWQVPVPEAAAAGNSATPPIAYHPHPLSTEAYNRLIAEADLGLLLHEPHSYYSRLSAVYQEYVCAGIPVIVPAGCWLGDQLADENTRYIEQLLTERQTQIVQHDATTWKAGSGKKLASLPGGRVSFRGSKWPLVAEISPSNRATELVVHFRWPEQQQAGQYVRVVLEKQTGDGRWELAAQVLLGPGKASANFATMFHLQPGLPGARVILSNAFCNEPITIANPQLTMIAAPDAGSSGLPLGQSGVAFSERSEIPRLIREVLNHYDHYRRRAQEKSPVWCRRLEPLSTLTELTSAPSARSITAKIMQAA
jgi:hypothetical protein